MPQLRVMSVQLSLRGRKVRINVSWAPEGLGRHRNILPNPRLHEPGSDERPMQLFNPKMLQLPAMTALFPRGTC